MYRIFHLVGDVLGGIYARDRNDVYKFRLLQDCGMNLNVNIGAV